MDSDIENLVFLILYSSDLLLAAYALKKLDEKIGIVEKLKKMLNVSDRVQIPAGAKR